MPFDIGQEGVDMAALELPSANDFAILKAMGDVDEEKELSFQGIKRKLGLHQETLSRALHRLQRDGYVERLAHAYKISQKGISTISQVSPRTHKIPTSEPYSVKLLQAVLPHGFYINLLVDSLSYKWFGNLRWLGSTQNGDSVTLSWITNETGVKISLKIKDDNLTIETYPKDSASISFATRSAFELFDNVSRALRSVENSSASLYSKAS
ncbi:MAG: hypothetical protein JRN20_17495 [Nitrososphaerota archaeon]|nr:hypothetical protein [Nitrososphaerota archaeon]